MKIRNFLLVFVMLFIGITTTTYASNATATDNKEVRAIQIRERVDQIKSMNFTSMTRSERKDVRHELKGLKTELRELGPTYVYISAGALILIIILLILLL